MMGPNTSCEIMQLPTDESARRKGFPSIGPERKEEAHAAGADRRSREPVIITSKQRDGRYSEKKGKTLASREIECERRETKSLGQKAKR